MLKYFFSIFKTLYINFVCFPVRQAIKFPIIVCYNTKLIGLRRESIIIKNKNIHFGMIKIGFGGTDFIDAGKTFLKFENDAKLILYGKTFISQGCKIIIEKNAKIILGDDVAFNRNCMLYACDEIKIGSNLLVGWNVNIRDNDGHQIYQDDTEKETCCQIVINDNVWIGAYVDILKGVVIEDNSIIATRSCVTKKFEEKNILIAGIPAKKIKDKMQWKK